LVGLDAWLRYWFGSLVGRLVWLAGLVGWNGMALALALVGLAGWLAWWLVQL